MYIKDIESSFLRPPKLLKGFKRIELDAEETKTAEFTIGPDELHILDENLNFKVESGKFEILVGNSSQDIRLRGILTVEELEV